MITAVLDTNVLASGFVRAHSVPGMLLALWSAGRYTLLLSEVILAELEGALGQPYFQRYLSQELVDAALAMLREEATVVPITAVVRGEATHPEDDLILATAASAKANYLVTGDKKLQKLGSYMGVAIVSPRELFDILHGPESEEWQGGGADKEQED